jgi:hypothetical protein
MQADLHHVLLSRAQLSASPNPSANMPHPTLGRWPRPVKLGPAHNETGCLAEVDEAAGSFRSD